jgi:hypothetical protein
MIVTEQKQHVEPHVEKLEKDCCVCMQIMVEPAKLPCNHMFCV